jgi:hypothetical protein
MANTAPNTAVPAAAPPNFNDNSNPEPLLVVPASAAVAADAGASLSTVNGAFVGDSHSDVPDGVPNNVCRAMAVYRKDNNLLRSLVVMSHGLLTEFNSEVHQWNTLKQKQWTSTNKQLVEEILRRWADYAWENKLNEHAPRPNQWKTPQLIEWLTGHPITLEDDGSTTAATDENFIKGEIARYKHRLIAYIQERAEDMDMLDGNWQGIAPICRLIHCLVPC